MKKVILLALLSSSAWAQERTIIVGIDTTETKYQYYDNHAHHNMAIIDNGVRLPNLCSESLDPQYKMSFYDDLLAAGLTPRVEGQSLFYYENGHKINPLDIPFSKPSIFVRISCVQKKSPQMQVIYVYLPAPPTTPTKPKPTKQPHYMDPKDNTDHSKLRD